MLKHIPLVLVLGVSAIGLSVNAAPQNQADPMPHPLVMPGFGDTFSDDQVAVFARLALKGLDIEYPNKPSNVMAGAEDVRSPKDMHPAFYGCFDWHSSVHGHWMLIRLLKLHPDCAVGDEIRAALDAHLTAENIRAEAAYFNQKHNRSFERMYGWAWALRLAAELHDWDDPQAQQWATNFKPLEDTIVALTMGFLPRLTWPIRTGVHPDTAFAFGQVLDYARTVGHEELEQLVISKAKAFYAGDVDYPAAYEPSGVDFFSPGLNEADLMRRVLDEHEFSIWLDQFFPTLKDGALGNLLTPVVVSDVTDGHLVHLAGLNLSRAWTMRGVLSKLPAADPRCAVLESAAKAHLDAGLRYVFSGHYEGEHWLATFAIYAISESGV
jgi:hypothetical protein